MKKYILLILILFFLHEITYAQFYSKFSIGIETGIGYDLQQSSKEYFPTRLIIPSRLGSSIIQIENPKRYNANIGYSLNENIDLIVSYGQTNRGLKYWSMDSLGTKENCLHCKLDLKIKQNDIFVGLKFKTDLNSKVNFYFSPSIGNTWIKRSSRNSANKDSPQTEVFSLHDDENWYMIHVLQQGHFFDYGTLSLNCAIGMSYQIWKSISLEMNINYNNELSNGSELIIWDYNKLIERRGYAYNPLILEFKSLFTNIGLRFDL